MLQKVLNSFCQRSTWIGLFLIYLALAGDYFGLFDEGTAVLLLIMGGGGFIPENSALAHKILEIVAPLLVHQIKLKATEKSKRPF